MALLVKINDGFIITTDDINRVIADACEELGIEDLTKESQGRFRCVLSAIGQRFFRDNKILKDNNNKWRFDIIYILCDYYISLSHRYNKLVAVYSFSEMVNIECDLIETWATHEPSSTSFTIWNKLHSTREHSLIDRCFDSPQILGTLSIGNREYSWALPGVSREKPREILGASSLPNLVDLSTMGEQKQIAINDNSDENPLK